MDWYDQHDCLLKNEHKKITPKFFEVTTSIRHLSSGDARAFLGIREKFLSHKFDGSDNSRIR
jgi:hypothetical protein